MFGLGLNVLTYALGGVALIALLGAGVQTWRIQGYATEVATARQHEAEALGQASKVNEIFAREEAKQEKRRADQAKMNTDELLRLRDERDALETRFKNISADRAKVAAENLRFRNNAPKTDSRDIGPTMRRVLSCLRQQQIAFRAGRSPPAC